MDIAKFKIGVIGLGPIGMVLAVHFKKAGCEVAICDMNKNKMNLIRNEGIKIHGKIKKSSYFNYVYTSIDQLLEHGIDILICAVKAYHVDGLLEKVEKESISKDLYVLSAQNGIDVKIKYISHFAESQILRMVVNFAGVLHAPNVVDVTFFNPPNFIASIDDSKEDLTSMIAAALTAAKLETISSDSFAIAAKIWEKTILNAALSPLCAITRLTMKEAMEHPDTLEIAEQIIIEATEVAAAEGIRFGDNFVKLCIRYLKNAGDHFPSLAVDLMNNKETEIDYINGKFVEFGKKHYIRTPLNLAFTNLIRTITHKNSLSRSTTDFNT